MSNETPTPVSADSLSLNVITESISRAILVVAGLVSSAILVRSTDISEIWTITDYAHLKVLMYWNQLISIVVLLGLTTAIVRLVSAYTHEPNKIGSVLLAAILSTTLVFSAVALITTSFADVVGFLAADTPAVTAELRAMWILVILSILPSAYLMIAKSFFSGLQRMKRSLIVDVTYNGSRIVILLLLFVNTQISLLNILYMYLGITLLGFGAATILIYREMKAENIPLNTGSIRDIIKPLYRISSTFFALALITSFGTIITPLLVNYFGTDLDMARYAIADSTLGTLRAFLYAPYAVLLPNITGMFSRGENDELRKRFDESNRIIIPTLIFAFLATFTFGQYFLGGIYGVRALGTTGGLSALMFMILMSPGLLIAPMVGIYSNVLVALDRMKALLAFGALSVSLQVIWIALLQPYLGVLALVFLWILSIPLFLIYHVYTRDTTQLTIGKSLMIRSAVLTLITAPFAYGLSIVADYIGTHVVSLFSSIPFITSTTFASLFKLLFLGPLWYLFLGLCLLSGVMSLSDLSNLKKFLRKIPPVWWVSKPFINYIEKFGTRRLLPKQSQSPATNV